jgi:hypothetical protein
MKIFKNLIIFIALMLIATPMQVLAFNSAQRFELERSFYYDPTDCVSGSSSSPSTAGGGAAGSVFVIGDSITANPIVAGKLTTALAEKGLTPIVYESLGSRRLSEGSDPKDGITVFASSVDKWKTAKNIIIELGTNGGVTDAKITKMMEIIKQNNPGAKVYWINVGAARRTDIDTDNIDRILKANQSLGYTVIDWNTVARANPGLITDDDVDVHPFTEAGSKLYADTVAGAIGGSSAATAAPAATNTAAPATTPTTTTATTPVATSPGSTVGAVVDATKNKAYDGSEVWTKPQLDQIAANQPFYEKAAQKVGIDWKLIPPLHLAETGLGRKNPSNGQGIYQDFARAGNNGANYPTGEVDDTEFQRQTDWAAGLIKSKADGNPEGLKDLSLPDGVKETYWGYNGKAKVYREQAVKLGFTEKQGYEGSPYVMNKADEKRDPAKNPSGWGQIKTDGGGIQYPANNFIGTFVHYTALGGFDGGASTSANGGCAGAPSSSIVATSAQKIVQVAEAEMAAGAKEEPPGSNSGAFVSKYTDGQAIAWCASFLSWVFKEAGAPFVTEGSKQPWLITSVSNLMDYTKNSGKFEWHDKDGVYIPKVGDIVIYKDSGASHTGLVSKVGVDSFTSLDGNWADKVTTHEVKFNDAELTGFATLKGTK